LYFSEFSTNLCKFWKYKEIFGNINQIKKKRITGYWADIWPTVLSLTASGLRGIKPKVEWALAFEAQ
jgi:hypothetical protein